MKLSYLIIIMLLTIVIVIFTMLILLHFSITSIHQISPINQLPTVININEMDKKISTTKYLYLNESYPIITKLNSMIITDEAALHSKDLERMKRNHFIVQQYHTIEYGTPIPNHAPKRIPFVMIRFAYIYYLFIC